MIAWMLWATLVAALIGAAAYLLEDVLNSWGRTMRWVWCAALFATVGLIGWSAVPSGEDPRTSICCVLPIERTQEWWTGAEGLRTRALVRRLDPYVGGAWLVGSSVLLVGLLGGSWRLRRRAAAWPTRRIAEHDVLLSDDFGPALLGFLTPRIVLPERLLSRATDDLAVVCLHEAQHRAARDTWLLGASALLAVAMPWNAAVWWQVTRLRGAIEIDCDRRVLRAGISPTVYANVLLSVGIRGERVALLVPTFFQPPPLLERRLTMVIQGLRRRSTTATLAALSVSAALVSVACETPAPASPLAPSGLVIRQLDQSDAVPLVLVDGVEVDGRAALDDMEAADIESVEIIKAVTAVPAYGERAADGVILITTKLHAASAAAIPPVRDVPPAIAPPTAPADQQPGPISGLAARTNGGLVIVDGVVEEDPQGLLERTDPDDIESIEVIKGPAALRLYGERAANGVIAITLKAR